MTTYNKYGQPAQCLSSDGPCKDICVICLRSGEQHFERTVKDKVYECKRYLEHCGFEVKETEYIPWDWIRGL